MPDRTATAEWKGSLVSGTGRLSTESGVLADTAYSYTDRFESGGGTNPEELIGAAIAGCFAMALAHRLAEGGHTPERVHVEARVTLGRVEEGFAVTGIHLTCRAKVPTIDDDAFQEQARATKTGCPTSRALKAVPIELDAALDA